jgi:hypothetical protein
LAKDAVDKIADGRIAGLLHMNLTEHVAQRRDVVIKELISAYRGGKLSSSPDLYIGRIAELSTLDALLSQLAREARQGESEIEQEIGRPAH